MNQKFTHQSGTPHDYMNNRIQTMKSPHSGHCLATMSSSCDSSAPWECTRMGSGSALGHDVHVTIRKKTRKGRMISKKKTLWPMRKLRNINIPCHLLLYFELLLTQGVGCLKFNLTQVDVITRKALSLGLTTHLLRSVPTRFTLVTLLAACYTLL